MRLSKRFDLCYAFFVLHYTFLNIDRAEFVSIRQHTPAYVTVSIPVGRPHHVVCLYCKFGFSVKRQDWSISCPLSCAISFVLCPSRLVLCRRESIHTVCVCVCVCTNTHTHTDISLRKLKLNLTCASDQIYCLQSGTERRG